MKFSGALAALLIVAGATFVAAAALIGWHNYRGVYSDFSNCPRSSAAAHPEQSAIAGLHEVQFRDVRRRRIGGWYVQSNNGATVVLVHGSNSDRAALLPEIRSLAAGGFGVLAIDWPGCGSSEGRIDWGGGEMLALTAALDWLQGRPGVDAGKIGGYGFSMGSYLLAQAAASDRRLKAVVLAGVPADIVAAARSHRKWGPLSAWPAEWAFFAHWDATGAVSAERAAPAISPTPVLVITSVADTIVPQAEARRVFCAAREPKELWVLPAGEHGSYPHAVSDYGARLVDYYSRTLLGTSGLLLGTPAPPSTW